MRELGMGKNDCAALYLTPLGERSSCLMKCAMMQESKQGGGASHALQVAVLVNAASMQANQGHLQQVRPKVFLTALNPDQIS